MSIFNLREVRDKALSGISKSFWGQEIYQNIVKIECPKQATLLLGQSKRTPLLLSTLVCDTAESRLRLQLVSIEKECIQKFD